MIALFFMLLAKNRAFSFQLIGKFKYFFRHYQFIKKWKEIVSREVCDILSTKVTFHSFKLIGKNLDWLLELPKTTCLWNRETKPVYKDESRLG